MATPRLGLVVEDKPTELSCIILLCTCPAFTQWVYTLNLITGTCS